MGCYCSLGGNVQVCNFGNQPQTGSEETPTAERPGESTKTQRPALALAFKCHQFVSTVASSGK